MKNKFGLVLLLIFAMSVLVKADVPPQRGYVRVRTDFVVETKEDLSEYRFFLNFYGDLREVQLKPNSKQTIPSVGGGARYSSAQFLAIPKTKLPQSDKFTDDESTNIALAIRDRKIEGLVELGTHSFIQDVKNANKKKVVTPTYLVSRSEGTLVMTQQKKNLKKVSWLEDEEDSPNTTIASVFLSLSIIFGGVFLIRKKSKEN